MDVRTYPREWRLPSLAGQRGKVVLVLYAITASMIFGVIAGSFWFNARDFFGNMPTAAEFGFRTRTDDSVPVVASVSRREQGRSDLRVDDRFVSINGVPLPADATEFTIAERLRADPDGTVSIVTQSANGTIRQHEIERRSISAGTIEASTRLPLWLYIAIGFTSAQLPLVVWFGASLFLAWRRPRDPEAMLLAFGFVLLCFTRGSTFWLHAFAGLPWDVIIVAENLAACVMLLAIAAFPDGRFVNTVSRVAAFLVAALALASVLVPALGLDFRTIDVFALLTVICIMLAIWRRYRATQDTAQQQQIKWAVFGFAAALAVFIPVISASALRLVPDDGPVPAILYLVIVQAAWLLIPAGLLISLMKYRLYDADAAISRSAAYATLTLLLAAIFAASAEVFEWIFQTNLGRDAGVLPSAIAAGAAVLAFTPLNNRLQAWAERRFQANLVRLRRELPECVDDLREISSREKLCGTILDKIVTGVRAERAAIVIGRDLMQTQDVSEEDVMAWLDENAPDPAASALDCDRADPIFPLRLPLRVPHAREGTFGWLLLGPRLDESFYGQDEREALAAIAGPIARAIQIVLVREAKEDEANRRRSEQEERIAKLERTLATIIERGEAKPI